MKTATVRELRNNFPRVAAWIEQGESVQITKSGKLFAQLSPAKAKRPGKFKMPDIMARLNEAFPGPAYEAEDMAKGLAISRGDRS